MLLPLISRSSGTHTTACAIPTSAGCRLAGVSPGPQRDGRAAVRPGRSGPLWALLTPTTAVPLGQQPDGGPCVIRAGGQGECPGAPRGLCADLLWALPHLRTSKGTCSLEARSAV